MGAEPKTKPTGENVDDFLNRIEDPRRREDAFAARAMLETITGKPAEMWGPSIVGFDRYSYLGPNKKPVEWPMAAFSPRKAELVFCISGGLKERGDLLAKLGKHRVGGGCLYIKRLSDVDAGVLRALTEWSYRLMSERHPRP
jgi:hypothetical protein